MRAPHRECWWRTTVLDMSRPPAPDYSARSARTGATPHPPAQQSGADGSNSAATRAQRQSLPEGGPSAASHDIGYIFSETGWEPSPTGTYKIFSGDDPTTARLERFVPLYYEGSPGAWATGSKSSMVFINSNLKALELALAVQPSTKDALTLRHGHILRTSWPVRSSSGRQPTPHLKPQRVQLGRWGGRNTISPMICSSNTNHIFNQHVFLTAGISACFPGAGIKAASPGKAPTWTGEFFNVVVNY